MNTRSFLPALSSLALTVLGLAPVPARAGETNDYAYDPPAAGTYLLPIIKQAADGTVLDHTGARLKLADLTRGRITVMSFIYTRCSAAKACPYATGVLLDLHQQSAQDPDLAQALRLISLSFDPVIDTPRRMAEFSTIADQHPKAAPWHFMTTRSSADLTPILRAYGQAVDKKCNANDPTGPLHHTLRVFLIDAAGRIRNIYSSGTLDPRLVLTDIRTLMRENAPITPAQAADRPGEVATIGLHVASAACVTDITNPADPQPLEVLLLDAPNADDPLTPTERAGMVIRVPATRLDAFGARSLDDLARRFEGKTVAITGLVALEPHPARSTAHGQPRQRPTLTLTDPRHIRIMD